MAILNKIDEPVRPSVPGYVGTAPPVLKQWDGYYNTTEDRMDKIRKRKNAQNFMYDLGTTGLKNFVEFRKPTSEEMLKGRSSKLDRANLLATGASWGMFDLMTGEIGSKVGKVIQSGGILNKTKKLIRNYNPKALRKDADRLLNISRDYNKMHKDFDTSSIDLASEAEYKLNMAEDKLIAPVNNEIESSIFNKIYLSEIDNFPLENIPIKETGGILEYSKIDFLHGAYKPHKKLSAGFGYTGEGAQAYGPGLYTSDNPGIHKYYMKPIGFKGEYMNPSGSNIKLIDQKAFNIDNLSPEVVDKFEKRFPGIFSNKGIYKEYEHYRHVLNYTKEDDFISFLKDDLDIHGTRYPGNISQRDKMNIFNYTFFTDDFMKIIKSNFDYDEVQKAYGKLDPDQLKVVDKLRKEYNDFNIKAESDMKALKTYMEKRDKFSELFSEKAFRAANMEEALNAVGITSGILAPSAGFILWNIFSIPKEDRLKNREYKKERSAKIKEDRLKQDSILNKVNNY